MSTAFWIQNLRRISTSHTLKTKEKAASMKLHRSWPGFQGQITINLYSNMRVQEQLETTLRKTKLLESFLTLLLMECQFLRTTRKSQVLISTETKHLPTTGRKQKRSDLSLYQEQIFLPRPTDMKLLQTNSRNLAT